MARWGLRMICLIDKRGFTLIEMLLVIIIIGIISAIAAPQFAKSMKGNRLRTAARSVVGAGRYARSMAVIHQRPMVITFDLENSSLVVAEAIRQIENTEVDEDKDEPVSALDEAFDVTKERPSTGAGVGVADSLERVLDHVLIAYVEVDGGESHGEGVFKVVYESNGRCIPYEIKLVDDDERSLTIKVDALASAITVGE